jgi:hypothetical protein
MIPLHNAHPFCFPGRETHSSRESFSVSRTVGSDKASCCRTPDPDRDVLPRELWRSPGGRRSRRHAAHRASTATWIPAARAPPPGCPAPRTGSPGASLASVSVSRVPIRSGTHRGQRDLLMCCFYYHETPPPPPFLLVPLLHFSKPSSSFSLQK